MNLPQSNVNDITLINHNAFHLTDEDIAREQSEETSVSSEKVTSPKTCYPGTKTVSSKQFRLKGRNITTYRRDKSFSAKPIDSVEFGKRADRIYHCGLTLSYL